MKKKVEGENEEEEEKKENKKYCTKRTQNAYAKCRKSGVAFSKQSK